MLARPDEKVMAEADLHKEALKEMQPTNMYLCIARPQT